MSAHPNPDDALMLRMLLRSMHRHGKRDPAAICGAGLQAVLDFASAEFGEAEAIRWLATQVAALERERIAALNS